jgi:hypothetical protein
MKYYGGLLYIHSFPHIRRRDNLQILATLSVPALRHDPKEKDQ